MQTAPRHLDARRARHPRVGVLDATEAERIGKYAVAVVRDTVELQDPVLETRPRIHLAGPEFAGFRVPGEYRLRPGSACRGADALDVLQCRPVVVAAETAHQTASIASPRPRRSINPYPRQASSRAFSANPPSLLPRELSSSVSAVLLHKNRHAKTIDRHCRLPSCRCLWRDCYETAPSRTSTPTEHFGSGDDHNSRVSSRKSGSGRYVR